MYQLNPQQLQEFSTLMKLNQYDQAEQILIEQLHISPIAAKNLVIALSKSDDAMKSFQANPQVMFADSPEFNKEMKSVERKSFEFSFSSSKVKMTNKEGKVIEIDDQHPDWQEIKKQFNIDLTQPDALSKFAESFMQGQSQNKDSQETFSSQDTNASPHSSTPAGVEDLNHQNKSSSLWLLIGFILLVGVAAFYYFKT